MKKIFAILMTICLLAGALSITAFAAEPGSDVVIRVRAQKKNGDIVELENGDFKSFVDGWEAAVDLANDHQKLDENNYDYVVVDLYADWKADEEGKFGNDDDLDGIENYTIYVPEDTRIVINMNGHTIDRGLGDNNEYDGEVIYVDENARLIINGGTSGDPVVKAGTHPGDVKMGTITGGNSDNGAGGIHIKDNAFVALTNVHVDGNTADDDYGAGIALYNGASLVMSGGSISNNRLVGTWAGEWDRGGAIYAEKAEVTISNVEIKNNQAYKDYAEGLAIYIEDSSVYVSDCIIDGNGLKTNADRSYGGVSVIGTDDAYLKITRTKFTNNGVYLDDLAKNYSNSRVIDTSSDSTIIIDECVFEGNNTSILLHSYNDMANTTISVSDSQLVNNNSSVYSGSTPATFENCSFGGNNSPVGNYAFTTHEKGRLVFRNCMMGDSTFKNEKAAIFQDANGNVVGSIFGEGSLTMIVALLALIASGVAIFLTVYYNKKKAAPVAVDTKEAEDEE